MQYSPILRPRVTAAAEGGQELFLVVRVIREEVLLPCEVPLSLSSMGDGSAVHSAP